MLEKIDRIEKPATVNADMKLVLTPHCQSGNDVLKVEDLAKSYSSHKLFENVNFEIKRGEHVAILGDNGTGKTTLLKILNELEKADAGSFTLGSKVEIGYYDQEHHVLHPEKNLYEEIADEYPYLTITEIRNTLAAFLFTGDDVFKLVRDLSGGERGRLSLAKLMLSDCNFLILDEPTNHLDIRSKEILETAINSYEGTVLYVSHDRYFINKTATRILELTGKGFVNFIGNYDYYVEKHEDVIAAASANGIINTAVQNESVASSDSSDAVTVGETTQSSALDWKAQKALAAEKKKKENALKKCEEAIAAAEDKLSEIDAQLNDSSNGNNVALLQELTRDRESVSAELEKLYEEWETLAE